jgi:hypothetical protein
MLAACRKRPLFTGVPQAELMLFFDGFSSRHEQAAEKPPNPRWAADIAGIGVGKVTNE